MYLYPVTATYILCQQQLIHWLGWIRYIILYCRVSIYGTVLARIGSVSTSCSCKKSLLFKYMLKQLKRIRPEKWFDGENGWFNMKVIRNSIFMRGMSLSLQLQNNIFWLTSFKIFSYITSQIYWIFHEMSLPILTAVVPFRHSVFTFLECTYYNYSYCFSECLKQHKNQWTDFHDVWYYGFQLKLCAHSRIC